MAASVEGPGLFLETVGLPDAIGEPASDAVEGGGGPRFCLGFGHCLVYTMPAGRPGVESMGRREG